MSNFGKRISAVANTPGRFIAGIPYRTPEENVRLGAYYLTQFGIMYASDEFLGMMEEPSFGSEFFQDNSYLVPQGLDIEEFNLISKTIFDEVGVISDDIAVQGSRASGTATLESDIDIAIKVSPEQFDELVSEYFGKPNPGSAKYRTMENAIKTGKIQAGEARLRSLRKKLEQILQHKIKEVDVSIIKKGGPFDNGSQIPLVKPKESN